MSYKPGEITTLATMTETERRQTLLKPWVQPGAGPMLAEAAAILSLLPAPPATVLECGCGDGWLCHMLSLCDYDVAGTDVCSDSLKAARRGVNWAGNQSTPVFGLRDWDDLGEPQYNALIFNSSLHHSVDRDKTLKSAWGALKGGGIIIISEPGIGHAGAKHVKAWANRAGVTEQSVPPFKLVRELRRVGFVSVKVYPKPSTLHGTAYSPSSFACYHPFLAKLAGVLPLSIASLAGKWFQGLVTAKKPL